MRFKPGQKVVCVDGTFEWLNTYCAKKPMPSCPKFNEIVTVWGYNLANPGFVILEEYKHSQFDGELLYFLEIQFEPLVEDSVFKEALSELTITV